MKSSAIISDCRRYRYLLTREWDDSKEKILFIMLNPSTADANSNDATVRSCIRLAKALGYGGLEIVNLMAYRATDPKDLPTKPSEAIGAGNASYIGAASERCETVVCAWGSHPYAPRFVKGAMNMVQLAGKIPTCFGTTKTGAPKHPLYLPTDAKLQEYLIDGHSSWGDAP